jgi:phosphate transport system permease protein
MDRVKRMPLFNAAVAPPLAFTRSLLKSGDPYIWFTGGAVGISLIMLGGLLFLVMYNGLGFFWPAETALITLNDGSLTMGRMMGREAIPSQITGKADAGRSSDGKTAKYRRRYKLGNRDILGLDFRWIDEAAIAKIEYPRDAVVIERREWGDFYGFVKELRAGGDIVRGEAAMGPLLPLMKRTKDIYARIHKVEKSEIGGINSEIERLRLKLKKFQQGGGNDSPTSRSRAETVRTQMERQNERYKSVEEELTRLYESLKEGVLVISTADGVDKEIPVGSIVRICRPNDMTWFGRAAVYIEKLGEFLWDDPREANTEGGIFPAIFGTVLMVVLMSVVAVPFGVIAAVYLREYARQGLLVSIVRICVNNLAGVPSIVYGIFGLGFFVYGVGAKIDTMFFAESLPTPTFGTGGILWASLTLALLTLPVVIVSTEEGLASVPMDIRHGSLAVGATKFETLMRIVLPSALPGILTGFILAIARATGEVAPLMLTGVVKLAPTLPLDSTFPFSHLERKFMHLGFHIYDVGFQSPNVEAAKPMVYTTTLLLILIVVALNMAAIALRNYVKKRYSTGVF